MAGRQTRVRKCGCRARLSNSVDSFCSIRSEVWTNACGARNSAEHAAADFRIDEIQEWDVMVSSGGFRHVNLRGYGWSSSHHC